MNHIEKCILDIGYIRYYLGAIENKKDPSIDLQKNSIEEMLCDIETSVEAIRCDLISSESIIAGLKKQLRNIDSELDFSEYESHEVRANHTKKKSSIT